MSKHGRSGRGAGTRLQGSVGCWQSCCLVPAGLLVMLFGKWVQEAPLSETYDVVLDAMFGFSFKGAPRPPFDALIEVIKT